MPSPVAHRRLPVPCSLFSLSLALLTACSGDLPGPIPAAHGEAAEPTRGGTLELASFADIRGLDPANMADGLAPQMLEAMFAGLLDFDEKGQIAPDLAESYAEEDEGRSYRFVLRQGVRFHDGEEVTAEDVKRSVERAFHPSAPNPYASFFESMHGFADFQAKKTEHLAGVRVEGRYVVRFTLDRADAVFLPVLAMPMSRPTCKSAGDRYDDTWLPCGAGPFKLLPGGWSRGRELRVVRHEGYFRPGLPRLDAVRWTFHVNQTSQRFKLLRGELDIVKDFLAPDLAAFQRDPRWNPFGTFEADKQVNGEAMNCEVPPFDNVEVRRAVSAAIDREQLRRLRATNLYVQTKPVPPAVPGYEPDMPGQSFDLDAALEHMKKAGFAYDPRTGKGGWPHVVPYLVYKQGLNEATGQVLMQQLARIGIRLEMRMVNYPTFMAMRGRRKESAMGPDFWQQDFPDALSFLEPLWGSKSIAEEDANNKSFYANPRYDELVEKARREPSAERRRRFTREAQEILVADAPWAFTYGYRFYVQRQPYVREQSPPHPVWGLEASRTWIDRAAGPVASRVLFERGARGVLASLLGDAPRPAERRP